PGLAAGQDDQGAVNKTCDAHRNWIGDGVSCRRDPQPSFCKWTSRWPPGATSWHLESPQGTAASAGRPGLAAAGTPRLAPPTAGEPRRIIVNRSKCRKGSRCGKRG